MPFNWPQNVCEELRLDDVILYSIESFTNAPQHKNGNVAKFVFDVPLEKNCTDEVYNLEMQFSNIP